MTKDDTSSGVDLDNSPIPTRFPMKNAKNGLDFPVQMHNQVEPNKIIIIAGHNGKDIAKFMTTHNRPNYSIQAILKPNSTTDTLIETVIKHSENLSNKDVVVLWTDRTSTDILKKFVLKVQHTNPVIITQPYRYDNRENVDSIYHRNLQLKKGLQNMNLPHTCILDCNNILRRSNYHQNGYKILARGKWYISKAIWEYVMGLNNITNISERGKMPSTTVDVNYFSHQNNSLANELQESLKNTILTENPDENFLYPRLSEVAPINVP
ncbi:uncharacterized protein [Leptinotarsa decemlineata]|uniref:uncharacterized protein n=1 Tax=Leptinotarsa decemlineata TaxID=7539 RepID=UPI003D304358